MPNKKYSLGIYIGGTNTVFGLVDKEGKVIKKESILTMPKNHPKLLLESIFNIISFWEKELKIQKIIKDIGVGVPNGNYFTGMVSKPPNLGKDWDELNYVN